ncbi:MAG: hypothetical protein MZW92_51385 [Comamonadaceae bacterium]|nr:hypothetical protein [Comamonadaceae bacterium]
MKVGDAIADGRRHRRRPVDRHGRAGARPERAGRVHAVERLQLRGRDPDLRARRARTTSSPRSTSRSSRCVARDTKLGPEEITRDIPNVGEEALDEPRRSAASSTSAPRSKPGDILVGKVTPKGETRADAGREAAARDLRREGRRT